MLSLKIVPRTPTLKLVEANVRVGAHGAGETPDTIPNSEAKPSSGDDTLYGESSTVPNYIKPYVLSVGFYLFMSCMRSLSAPKIKMICTT